MHGEETVVYTDAGYQGMTKRPERQSRSIGFRAAMRPGTHLTLLAWVELHERVETPSISRSAGGADVIPLQHQILMTFGAGLELITIAKSANVPAQGTGAAMTHRHRKVPTPAGLGPPPAPN